ncbi:hypothetical protein BLNAU_5334 [Blattamonas nauphoetae]|uniref:Amine oxidase domain-containing protein n=1 Tax=Blattamonas nauphoetae TaxID=2049346 RepID=A0ABQ9Y7W8_9EUKA|nr:hypothetical protein BLNAU_5334 [Blattamonas nauphoetae]
MIFSFEDLLGEDANGLLHIPQTRPGRSLKETIRKLPKEQQQGIDIRIQSKYQHSRDSEQADVVIVTLPADTVLPVPLTFPHPHTAHSPVATKVHPVAHQEDTRRVMITKRRQNQHCSPQSPTLIVPFRLFAHSRCLRTHTTSSSSSRRVTQKARSTHSTSLAVWESRAGRERVA